MKIELLFTMVHLVFQSYIFKIRAVESCVCVCVHAHYRAREIVSNIVYEGMCVCESEYTRVVQCKRDCMCVWVGASVWVCESKM